MSEAAAIMGREGARSLGAQFAAAREKRGLSIEKVIQRDPHPRAALARDRMRRFLAAFRTRAMHACSPSTMPNILAFRFREFGACFLTRENVARRATNISRRLPAITCGRTFAHSVGAGVYCPKLVAAALLVLFGFGGFKLWITIRDIERLGLNRMARENKAELTVPQNVLPAKSVTPERPSDSTGTETGGTPAPVSESPVGRSVPSDTESTLLVGADLDSSDRIP